MNDEQNQLNKPTLSDEPEDGCEVAAAVALDGHEPHTAQADTPEPHPQEPTAELDPREELEAEAARWKETALRTAAEMDNLRKRTAREREEALRFLNQRLLEELLPVIDNFEMGMAAAAQDKSSMIYIGMDMVRRQLHDFLSSQGVVEIPASGRFDHNLHEAVAQEPSTEHAEGTIIRCTRKGYLLHERLLRPASVIVAKRAEEAIEPS